MKKILVPTDFSVEASNALKFAAQIAEKTKAEIHVLHVANLPVVADPMGTNLHAYLSPETLESMEQRLREQIDKFSSGIKTSVPTIDHFDWGNVFTVIDKLIDSEEIDLVVMGSKGAAGFRELFIGSNTERVIRMSRVPVITVKSEVDISSVKRVVFATDLSEECNMVVKKFSFFQELFGAEVHVVRVNTPASFETDLVVRPLLNEFVRDYELKNVQVHVYNDTNEDLGLIHFADMINADMIALSTHGKRGFGHFISGSIAEDIVNHAKRPIWTCRIE